LIGYSLSEDETEIISRDSGSYAKQKPVDSQNCGGSNSSSTLLRFFRVRCFLGPGSHLGPADMPGLPSPPRSSPLLEGSAIAKPQLTTRYRCGFPGCNKRYASTDGGHTPREDPLFFSRQFTGLPLAGRAGERPARERARFERESHLTRPSPPSLPRSHSPVLPAVPLASCF
jgi:hypothetical protein